MACGCGNKKLKANKIVGEFKFVIFDVQGKVIAECPTRICAQTVSKGKVGSKIKTVKNVVNDKVGV